MTSTAILIPARYGSTRFPGKPLCDLGGVTMVERVVDACQKTGLTTVVLTDDVKIHRKIMNKCMVITDPTDYANGTERCAGAIKDEWLCKFDRFINVQGDMPDVTVDMIKAAEKLLDIHPVSTVVTQMLDHRLDDPNTVKLTRAGDRVLWCGRGMQGYGDWHLGIYGYRRDALEKFPHLTITREERIEGLEQLRWLKNGWQMGVSPVVFDGVEINTPEDADKWNKNNPLG